MERLLVRCAEPLQLIPSSLEWLFWDVDPSTIELDRHADYVLERVMSRGDFEAMRWLVATYSKAVLAEFLSRKGQQLAPRERAFWSLMAGVRCDVGPGGGRPPWAGPT
jgi:hypothetical protein